MELVLILVVALLVLGPKRMPELARTLGRGLGEFRRASNDLRQSLALDDLQNELRDELSGTGKNKKPAQDLDRPAQAGDDLAPTADREKSASEESAETAAGRDASPRTHPGELPLDTDPNIHRDRDEASEKDPPASSAAPKSADSTLGNVPVGGATPRGTDDERG